jgi:hypothetical protein
LLGTDNPGALRVRIPPPGRGCPARLPREAPLAREHAVAQLRNETKILRDSANA